MQLLIEDFSAGIERGSQRRKELKDLAHQVVGDATLYSVLVNTLVAAQRIEFDARQALREERRRQPHRFPTAAAFRLRIPSCCALPLRLGYLESALPARASLSEY